MSRTFRPFRSSGPTTAARPAPASLECGGTGKALARDYGRCTNRASAEEVHDDLIFLHEERGSTWQGWNCVHHGIRFFYCITLGRAKQHFCLPDAGTPSILPELFNDALVRLFAVTTSPRHRAVLMTACVAGRRSNKLGRLRISDIDSQGMCLLVDQGNGNRDRSGPLSPRR